MKINIFINTKFGCEPLVVRGAVRSMDAAERPWNKTDRRLSYGKLFRYPTVPVRQTKHGKFPSRVDIAVDIRGTSAK